MCFPTLHLFKWIHVGVAVIQPEYKAQSDLVIGEVIEKTATEAVVRNGPTRGVDHQAWLSQCRVNFPQLLDTNGKSLRVFAFVQAKTLNELFA